MKYFAKICSLILINKNIQSNFKAINIYPSIDHFKILDKFPLHESINTTSQNNTTERPAISEAEDITLAYNLRENPVLNTSILNILEKKLVKKKIVDIFNSILRDLFNICSLYVE